MNLDNIKEKLIDYLKTKDLKVFEISYHKSDETLSILLDEDLKMDDIEKISNEISTYLDQFENEFAENYILDVSTVGAERPIRNEEELIVAIVKYIYVKTKESEYYGTLKTYADNIMQLEVKNKTRVENVSVEYNKTKVVRYAVKF